MVTGENDTQAVTMSNVFMVLQKKKERSAQKKKAKKQGEKDNQSYFLKPYRLTFGVVIQPLFVTFYSYTQFMQFTLL